ncbi:MAG: glycosyltransferase [Hyphomicrobiales bacterium]|jgi:glycosyltransferase involved in cell wall biosynthesis|nr:glycosyltransferase [Hyphomicrobiales bacterium]
MPRLLLVGSEDWLFALRHLPAVRAALELGLDPVVVARESGHRRLIEAAGARFVALPAPTRSRSPQLLWRQVTALRQILTEESPDLLHCLGLRAVLLGRVAAMLAGNSAPCICAFNGLGPFCARPDAAGALLRALARTVLAAMASRGALLLFDNPDDPALLGLTEAVPDRVRVIGGLGVDPVLHGPEPMPWAPPLKLVFGSPLLWANGPDLAVAAVRMARAKGLDVTLSLIGAAFPPSPRAVPAETLSGWSAQPGISWYGPTPDIGPIWRQHHALILPSRGGDGLPAILSQAAAACRPVITTDVAGCGSFVRDGIDGCVVPSGDVEALTEAIALMARAPGLVERMGRAGRDKVLAGYAERDVMEALKAIWGKQVSGQGAP